MEGESVCLISYIRCEGTESSCDEEVCRVLWEYKGEGRCIGVFSSSGAQSYDQMINEDLFVSEGTLLS